MNKFSIEEFGKSIQTGFINKFTKSDILYQPELLVNRKEPKVKVLSSLKTELDSCESFNISVAFVTSSGVTALMNNLISLEERGIKGKVFTSRCVKKTFKV